MADNTKLRIAMFPWLAFGHMIPWLQLAKLIAQKGHEIIFISTPRNIDRLPKLSPNLASFIHFVKLPLPQVENLPEYAEATMDLHHDDVWYLKQAYDRLQEPMKHLLQSLSPDWIFYDFTAYWLPTIARQLGIPHGFFSIFNAAVLGYFGPPSALINRADHDLNTPEDYTRQPNEAQPSQEELTEIAFGLELSGLPFFWVLKKRLGPADTKLIELPDGFEERTKRRGVVCTSWAPQLKILAHDSVGGFLSHSGWSSVVEALQFGRALVLLTSFADQGLIAKQLAEKKIGYVLPRKEGDGSFTRNSVAESLRLVVVEEEGKFYREKAMEMRGLFGDRGRQDQ
ncbi:hypothetical protein Patl1_27080 [Pistacia atlantica]|uniref:Uncharacterized protein n=1 Tax=Pistacia atlantica TaxID=434234 RepID=A0ACC1B0J4_9ROSI|nr:hypothetical protein Patl1_27080 [Pistacia atlantica]